MNKKEDFNNVSEYADYIGKKVKILLFNNYSYTGLVIDATQNSLKIRDKFGSLVEFSPKAVMIISEVQNGE